MIDGRAALLIGIVAAVAIIAACARPNADGWWDESAHAVDGYWVTHERPCEPEGDDECKAAIETATAILLGREPNAVITRAVTASYPTQRGKDPNEMTIIIGGLVEPRFAILDLADGSRRTIGLSCGPDLDSDDGNMRIICAGSDMETWRVTGS